MLGAFKLPVTIKLPEIIALPVKGNGATYPVKCDAVTAYEADVAVFAKEAVVENELDTAVDELTANELVTLYDPDVLKDELTAADDDSAQEADVAEEALILYEALVELLANEADVENDAEPTKFPVKLPENDPVKLTFICLPCIKFNAIFS